MTIWPIRWRRLRRLTGGALAALYLLVFALAAAGHAHRSMPAAGDSVSSTAQAGQAGVWLPCESPETGDAESCPLCDKQLSQPARFDQPQSGLVTAPARPRVLTAPALGLRQAQLRLSQPRGPPSLTRSTQQSV